MMRDRQRFVIVDPSLKDGRGHHYELTSRITQSILKNGFVPVWLCNKNFIFDKTEIDIEILPIINVSLYDAYIKKNNKDRKAPRTFSLISPNLSGVFKKLFKSIKNTGKQVQENFARDILKAIRLLSITPEERLLFHTADGMTYAALDRLFRITMPKSVPIIHVCTPYDPTGVMPNQIEGYDLGDIIRNWSVRGILDKRIFLYGENLLLAEHLSKIWRVKVRPLELPALTLPSTINKDDFSDRKSKVNGRINVVYLGPARLEKGFHLIPDIIQHTLEYLKKNTVLEKSVHFVLQCSPQIIGYSAEILKAIERLQAYKKDYVTLLPEILSTKNYLELLKKADVVLLPYGTKEYKFRSSGIVSEALSFDKIIVAKSGTYPAAAITHGGGLSGNTPQDMALAIAEIAINLKKYKAQAKVQGTAYRARNREEHYVLQCLNTEEISRKSYP